MIFTLWKLIQKTEKRQHFSIHFMWPVDSWYQPDKGNRGEENYKPVILQRCKNSEWKIAKYKNWNKYWNIYLCYHATRLKEKNFYHFTSTKEVFCIMQHLFMIILVKLGLEGNFLNLTKGVYQKPQENIILNSEILRVVLLSLLLFNRSWRSYKVQ